MCWAVRTGSLRRSAAWHCSTRRPTCNPATRFARRPCWSHSQAVLEFSASIYNELNRESQYFEILIKLFDVYLHSGNVAKAAESLERLVDIDAYDYRNQERLELLRGRVDEAYWKRVGSRLAKSGTETAAHTSHSSR